MTEANVVRQFVDPLLRALGWLWHSTQAATKPAKRLRLRDEIDALVAHLYGLSRADFAHILGTFPLVFPNTDEGAARRDRLLAVFEGIEL